MKKLILLCFLAHLPVEIYSSITLPTLTDGRVKIVNPRRQKLILEELHRAFEHSNRTLLQYRHQNQLNKELPIRLQTTPKKADVQKHLNTYTTLKKIYDEYLKTQELLISFEILKSFVREQHTLDIFLREARAQEALEDTLTATIIDVPMEF